MPAGKYIRTDAIRLKNKLGNTGKKHTEAFKKAVSERVTGEGNPFFGKHHSLEVKEKLSATRRDKNLKENAGYQALHTYIKRRKPKPDLCERCKSRKPFDLSNNSGKYLRDINDYEWLCRSCHNTKDKKVGNIKWMQKFIGKENKEKRICMFCKKEFAIYKSLAKRAGYFCSRSCSAQYRPRKRRGIDR